MAPHATKPFAQILDEVRACRAWLDGIGVPTAGTRLEAIEATLGSFLGDLEALPVAELTAQWDWAARQDAYYALTEGEGFGRIHEQLSTLKSDRLPRSELKRALQGPLVPLEETPASTDPRNVFMELDLAASLMRAGVEVTGFDDIRYRFEKIGFVAQCKRPFSTRSVRANVESAWSQIDARAPRGSYLRGIIALAVDKVLGLDQRRPQGVVDRAELDSTVLRWGQEFMANHRADWEDVADDRLVGVLLVFRFLVHTLPPVNTISAVHYEVLTPTAPPGTKDRKRLRRLGARLAN